MLNSFITLSTSLSQSNEISKLKANYAVADSAGSKSTRMLATPQPKPGKQY